MKEFMSYQEEKLQQLERLAAEGTLELSGEHDNSKVANSAEHDEEDIDIDEIVSSD